MFNECAIALGALNRASRSVLTLAFMFLMAVGQPAAATTFAFCGSTDVTVTNLPTSLAVAPGSAAGTALGNVFTVKVTMQGCNGGDAVAPNVSMYAYVPFGTSLTQMPTVSGISHQIVGSPSYTTSGSCGSVTLVQSTQSTQLNLSGTMSNCTASLSVSARYYLGASRIRGTQTITAANGYGSGNYCANPSTCSATRAYGPGSGATSSGIQPLLAYVPACAGVLNGTQTVQLPKVRASIFQGNLGPVAKTGFQILLGQCLTKENNGEAGNPGYDAYVAWNFSACIDFTVICSTGSSNVSLQILKSDSTTAVSRGVHNGGHLLATGTTSLQYYAAYINPDGAAVTPGTVSAQATFTISYE